MSSEARGDAARRRPLFGRTDVVEEVERAYDNVGTPAGQPLLVVGAGGSGKSTILADAGQRAEARGFLPVAVRATPSELAEPLRIARDLLIAAGEDETALGALLPAAPRRSEEETAGTSGGEEELERLLAPLGRTSVEGLGSVLQATRVRFLERVRELAGRRPLAILVDDLHLADPLSLDFLDALAHEGAGTRAAFVATIDAGPAVPDRVRPAIARLRADPTFKTVTVRPFTPPELAEFATWLRDGQAPGPEDVLRWRAETDGHPLFVELLVRSASGSSRHAERIGAAPESLTQVLLSRAGALDDVDRRVLTYASVLGREFEFARLASVTELAEERLSEAVERLVRGGILRERGREVYEFASEEFRASLYATITETRRAILHRKVAGSLESQRRGVTDFELARHFYLGRDDAKAIEYGLRAADHAAGAYAFDTALLLVRQALEAARRLPKRDRRLEVRLLTEAGRLLDETGDLPGAEQALSEAVALAREEREFDVPLGRALLGLAWARVERSDYQATEPLALEAAARLEKAGSPRDLLAAHRVLGTLYWRRSDLELAERHQRAALAIAEREGTPHEHGHALVDVANALLPRGEEHVETTLALYEKAATLFARLDDPNASARVLMNRAVLEHRIGRRDEALRDIGRALDAAERSRSPIWIGYCLINLAHWRAELGEADLARQLVERADRTLAPTGDRLARQQLQMIRGIIAEQERRYDDAEREFVDSLATARWMGMKGEVAEMLFRRARLAWTRGDRAGARSVLAEAKANGLDELRVDLAPEARKLASALEGGGDRPA
ncbi:MAG TPA: AAA family ATPase [Thermoplasmata archaeon]|nr:AAA family ATPase [Thermoplasmata archaeon]